MDTFTQISTVLALVFLLTSIYLYTLQTDNVWEVRRPGKEVAVCVMSARDHFQQREALRDTWVGGIRSNPDLNQRIQVWFVVGNKDCDLAPEARLDVYDCEPRPPPPAHLPADQDLAAFSLLATDSPTPLHLASTRIAVQVLQALVVRRLGVPELLPLAPGLTVTLILASQSEVLQDAEDFLQVKFSASDPGILHQGFRYQPVVPVSLPQVL